VIKYRSLAGRPVWPARDRCDKPHSIVDPLTAARDARRAHRSADLAEAPPREADATLRTEDWKHRFRRG
jgi:hypothetical protein